MFPFFFTMTAKESLENYRQVRIEAMEAEILKLNLLLVGYKLANEYQKKINQNNYEKNGNENRETKN